MIFLFIRQIHLGRGHIAAAAMNIEGSVVAATVGVVIHIFLALLFLFSTVANILVLIIFYRRPALRTISNRYTSRDSPSSTKPNIVLNPIKIPLNHGQRSNLPVKKWPVFCSTIDDVNDLSMIGAMPNQSTPISGESTFSHPPLSSSSRFLKKIF